MKIQQLEEKLSHILREMIDSEDFLNYQTTYVHEDYKLSAKNLLRYLIIRSKDLRKYHDPLSDLGVSALRTAEAYVYSNLYNVVRNLNLLQGIPFDIDAQIERVGFTKSKKLLRKHANILFGKEHKKHFTEIMVTLPEEAAHNKALIRKMVLSGMRVARINLSHGDVDLWEGMLANIRETSEETGQKVKIYMDLSGPKLRTSSIEILSRKGKIKNRIKIKNGDKIILTKKETLGKISQQYRENGAVGKIKIGVMLGEVVDDAMVGDSLLFDDGMIQSKVIAKKEDELELVITKSYKSKLGSHKGINLPKTKLHLPALTAQDLEVLPFVCRHADIIGYSFVRRGQDVKRLYSELEKYNAEHIGVVFKIENKEAFENLPEILINGMERNKIGVMIARGDLAIEIGFERISEVQNEILWICEAAHVPVIWATQVLENLAKTGIPTRAEISDAAKAAQAECVMLNKGPHIISAIRVLKNILVRMKAHSFKKKNELRALNVAKMYVERWDEISAIPQNAENSKAGVKGGHILTKLH
ncbi:MAG: pyruvate kinase [Flavobacteriaceae bacterium]